MGEVGDRAKELAEAAMQGAAIIGDDFKVEVSLVGLILSLKESVTAGFAEMGARLERKADKSDLELIRAEMSTTAMRVETIEEWRRGLETAEETRKARDGEEWDRWRLVGRVIAGLYGIAATVMIILATAGVFHP